ncbi:MAG TPA: response regulator transcription factor [Acidimicrobiales bacterium]|nr:response regulator transcription factor [Acidimicrobiales bacterium]
MKTRVLLVDDHRAFAEAVAFRLEYEPELEVVGVAASRADAESYLRTTAVDVLVVDLRLGAEDGLELASAARQAVPGLQVVVLSHVDDVALATAALRAGALSFLSTETTSHDLVAALKSAGRGEMWLAPAMLEAVIRHLLEAAQGAASWRPPFSLLTPREIEVLNCMARGMSCAAIAEQLSLSTHTVRSHVQNMLNKLNVHSGLEAVALARRAGVVDAPEPGSAPMTLDIGSIRQAR